MAVKLLRLKSGEDIVADVKEENLEREYTKVKLPAMLVPMGGQGQQMQMALAPWLPFSDDKEFTIPSDWILITSEPALDIVNNYNQMFGSCIVVPKVSPKTLLNE